MFAEGRETVSWHFSFVHETGEVHLTVSKNNPSRDILGYLGLKYLYRVIHCSCFSHKNRFLFVAFHLKKIDAAPLILNDLIFSNISSVLFTFSYQSKPLRDS